MRTIDAMVSEAQKCASLANRWRVRNANDGEHAAELRQPEPADAVRPQLPLFNA